MSVPELPYPHHDEAREAARDRVSTPAVILMVLGVLGALMSCLNMLTALIGGGGQNEELLRSLVQDDALVEQALALSSGPLVAFGQLVALVASVVVAFGAWKMYRLESWALAMTAAIVSLVPCTSPCCCCFAMPVGIWALVVLMDPKVQAAFD